MLVEILMAAALSAAPSGLPAPTPSYRSQAGTSGPAGQDSDEIVVTGVRLRATKVDYRRRGGRIAYCGARDDRQDARAVTTICGFLEACALGGARSSGALSDRVEARIAAQGRRGH